VVSRACPPADPSPPRCPRALLAVLALLAGFGPPAAAEVASFLTLSGYGTLARASGDAVASALLKTRLDLQSRGNENVRAQLQLDGWIGEEAALDIPRAWLRVRLPWFRLTIGKTRLSWGEGFVFNAGDVLFDSLSALAGDLSAAALRDQTAWLAAAYVPLGAFSFLEAVTLPFGVPDAPGLSTDPNAWAGLLAPQSFAELAGGAGLRGVFKLWGVKLESGWYVDWAQRANKPYLSLQGHLLADWNLSAVLAVPMDDPRGSDAGQWLAVTAGLFHLARLGGDRSLTLRLESMLSPGGMWTEATGAEAQPAGDPDAPTYGLLLYPEAALALSSTFSLQLRALVSPVDDSALVLLGAAWSPYQGLTLLAYATTMAGDADDLYRWDTWGPALTLGAEFVF
jgi:hypothetical protein